MLLSRARPVWARVWACGGAARASSSVSKGLKDVPAGRIIPPRTARFDDSLFDVEAATRRLQDSRKEEQERKDDGDEAADADTSRPPDRYYDGSEAVDSELWRSTARKFDREGALAASFLPQPSAEAMYVLRSVNGEVSRVVDAARGNAQAAALRFSFWRDLVLRASRGRGHPHPISVPLGVVLSRFDMTERYLLRLVDARAEDARMRYEFASNEGQEAGFDVPGGGTGALYQPETIEDLEEYADATEGSLGLLCLEALGIRGSEEAEAAAGYVGRAVVIANMLRGMPIHAAAGQVYLPREVTESAGISAGDVLSVFRRVAGEMQKLQRAKEAGVAPREGAVPQRGSAAVGTSEEAAKAHERLIAASYELAVAGNDNLRAARELAGSLPRDARQAMLPAIAAAGFYARFERFGFDPCRPDLIPRGQLALLARMGWSWARGTY